MHAPPFPELSDATLAQFETRAPRYTSYPTVPAWQDGFGEADYRAALERAGRTPEAPLSLYFHIPFCRERCTFCGCNVVIARDQKRADPYIDSLVREMDLAGGHLGSRRSFSQLHFGGGTPTFLNEAQLRTLWGHISARFTPTPDAEISIEIDPAVTSAAQIQTLRSLGFNRISMGVQDFAPEVQQAIRRLQTIDETAELLEAARREGFQGVNFDLIYGLPRQTPASWDETLARVIRLRPDRLAIYSFAHVPTLRPHQKRIEEDELPRGRAKLELFRQAYERLLAAGYRHIGMDHFALPTDPLIAAQESGHLGRNFQGYTVQSAKDMVAFGVSAISDVGGVYAQNDPSLLRYQRAIDDGHFATVKGHVLSSEDQRRRALIGELMCHFRIEMDESERAHFARELDELGTHPELATVSERSVTLTPLARLFVRNVAAVFDPYLREGPQATFSSTV